jgi:hypothetical protein
MRRISYITPVLDQVFSHPLENRVRVAFNQQRYLNYCSSVELRNRRAKHVLSIIIYGLSEGEHGS